MEASIAVEPCIAVGNAPIILLLSQIQSELGGKTIDTTTFVSELLTSINEYDSSDGLTMQLINELIYTLEHIKNNKHTPMHAVNVLIMTKLIIDRLEHTPSVSLPNKLSLYEEKLNITILKNAYDILAKLKLGIIPLPTTAGIFTIVSAGTDIFRNYKTPSQINEIMELGSKFMEENEAVMTDYDMTKQIVIMTFKSNEDGHFDVLTEQYNLW
jgi:hypothetical protein